MSIEQILIPFGAAAVGCLLGFFYAMYLIEDIKEHEKDQDKTQDDDY